MVRKFDQVKSKIIRESKAIRARGDRTRIARANPPHKNMREKSIKRYRTIRYGLTTTRTADATQNSTRNNSPFRPNGDFAVSCATMAPDRPTNPRVTIQLKFIKKIIARKSKNIQSNHAFCVVAAT